MQKTIIWIRRDFRIADNPALEYAYKNGHQVIFLYIDDEIKSMGAASKWFLHQVMASFSRDIKKRYGASLLIKSGEPLEIINQLIDQYKIDNLFYNRIYEPWAIKRDSYIKSTIKNVQSFNASLLFEPTKIKNLSGQYFKVFTPFWKKCLKQINDVESCATVPKSLHLIDVSAEQNLDLEQLNLLPKKPDWAQSWTKIYNISEEAVHDQADVFIKNKVNDYREHRNYPDMVGTSMLSPFLHFGMISAKQLCFKLFPYMAGFEKNAGVDQFLAEIGWREFSHHLLYHFPELDKRNFKSKFDNFVWENNPQELKKWQKGQTGFPIVDAGMRQLWQTGWMHNRVRMIVASFLTKNLLIDWRIGQEWFWDCLVDADLAANSASWQWVAGSGADAAPYFRIFNPVTQGQRFDPNAQYIKKWLPEISHLDAKQIHNPDGVNGYYEQMIGLKFSRNRALDFYKNLVDKA